MTPPLPPVVVLGSSSRYRRELLARLLPAFEMADPRIDEAILPGEAPDALARRLAALKSTAVARDWPTAVVIGADQVAACAGRILGKPGSRERAIEQLTHCAGRELLLYTAVHIGRPAGLPALDHLDRTALRFRALTPAEIAAYVSRDAPIDCAGAFRFESLGIALFSGVTTVDPTAIQGLPLLWLATALAQSGVPVL